MPDTRLAEQVWPTVTDWFLTSKYAPAECVFIDDNIGKSPGVALQGKLPDQVIASTVAPALQRIRDLMDLAESGDPRYFPPDVLVTSVRNACYGHIGYCAERAELKARTGAAVPHDSMFAYDQAGRVLGYQGPGADHGRVRVFDVPLTPQSQAEFRRLASKWVEQMKNGEKGDPQKTEDLRQQLAEAPEPFVAPLIPTQFIMGTNFYRCPVPNCEVTEPFKVTGDNEPHVSSQRAAWRRMLKHCKVATEFPDIHRSTARAIETQGPA